MELMLMACGFRNLRSQDLNRPVGRFDLIASATTAAGQTHKATFFHQIGQVTSGGGFGYLGHGLVFRGYSLACIEADGLMLSLRQGEIGDHTGQAAAAPGFLPASKNGANRVAARPNRAAQGPFPSREPIVARIRLMGRAEYGP